MLKGLKRIPSSLVFGTLANFFNGRDETCTATELHNIVYAGYRVPQLDEITAKRREQKRYEQLAKRDRRIEELRMFITWTERAIVRLKDDVTRSRQSFEAERHSQFRTAYWKLFLDREKQLAFEESILESRRTLLARLLKPMATHDMPEERDVNELAESRSFGHTPKVVRRPSTRETRSLSDKSYNYGRKPMHNEHVRNRRLGREQAREYDEPISIADLVDDLIDEKMYESYCSDEGFFDDYLDELEVRRIKAAELKNLEKRFSETLDTKNDLIVDDRTYFYELGSRHPKAKHDTNASATPSPGKASAAVRARVSPHAALLPAMP